MPRHERLVTVVTCDIVNSSRYPSADRVRIQKYLLKSWGRVQRNFGTHLRSRLGFRVTAGDEFQFVCDSLGTAFSCLILLRILTRYLDVSPQLLFRAGIGIGTRTIQGPASPYEQDGPAFALARKALEQTRRERYQLTAVRHEELTTINGIVNDLLPLTDVIYQNWTVAQARVLELTYWGKSGQEIARRLNIAPATVSLHQTRARFSEYCHGIDAIERLYLPNFSRNRLIFWIKPKKAK